MHVAMLVDTGEEATEPRTECQRGVILGAVKSLGRQSDRRAVNSLLPALYNLNIHLHKDACAFSKQPLTYVHIQ